MSPCDWADAARASGASPSLASTTWGPGSFGTEANHAVLFRAFMHEQRRAGVTTKDAIHHDTAVRLRTALMTPRVGIAGLFPLAPGVSECTEAMGPTAIAVIGGLIPWR